MLPIEQSPSKQAVIRSQRLLDWVEKSSLGLPPSITSDSISSPHKKRSRKRKTIQDENKNIDMTPESKKLRQTCSRSEPLSPSKFYVPTGNNVKNSKAFILPSTPESKRSASSGCFSPDKLEGVFVRKRASSCQQKTLSDSDSPPSTPSVKTSNSLKLPCSLDSPVTEPTRTPSTGGKKFSKLGHRLQSKTALQVIKESIKKSTRQVRSQKGSGKRHEAVKPKVCRGSVEGSTTDTEMNVSASSLPSNSHSPSLSLVSKPNHIDKCTVDDNFNTNSHHIDTSNQRPGSADRCNAVISDDIDKSNNTLVEEKRLVQKKLLPLFQRNAVSKDKTQKEQLVIDAGQKNLDEAYQCSVCRMIYTRGNADDEAVHRQFHSSLLQALKFSGWKKENVAEKGDTFRVVYIDYNDPPYCRKKVEAVKVILDQELGYVQEQEILKPNRRVYLYVSEEKQIRGVCIAEYISRANRLEGDKASVDSVRAKLGINRLWVYSKYRRQGVATTLLNAIRATFGMGVCISSSDMAFSDPTSHGKQFAARYTGTSSFLIYKP
ncbi:ESCO1 [Bugula neritina]|uniref:ESCO1 n=1 Tax=Bugula neritina TaxID=10212 RepID=A0A7J7KQ64_BUGNE|nr:ESCO1 [Bugula neritina]